jgi:hypothetical protein
MYMMTATLMNPNDPAIPCETLHRWVSDEILDKIRKFGQYDRPNGTLYTNSAYDLVIGACHYPVSDLDLSAIFDGLGADDETNRELGWFHQDIGIPVNYHILVLFDD